MMSVESYENLWDYLEPEEVCRLTDLCLRESSNESPNVTLSKLRILGDRQWHTYEPAPEDIHNRLEAWLLENWSTDSQDFFESTLVISYCYGLDKNLYTKALKEYQGEGKREFELDLDRSAGKNIDPWWSMGPRNEKQ